MNTQLRSAKVSLWVNRFVALILGVLLFALPKLLDWYSRVRSLDARSLNAIMAAFYCCAVVAAIALWNMDRLMRNILAGQVFTMRNVRLIRGIQWCCGGVSLICLPAFIFYQPLIFMVVIMAFLFITINVLTEVMKRAVDIREENDLTV